MEDEKFTTEEIEKLKESVFKDGGEQVYKLGEQYSKEGKHAKAFECFQAASFYGEHTPSMVTLGHRFESGRGTDVSFYSAVNQYEIAAKLKNGEAQFYLGVYYLEGIFYLRNYTKAFNYLVKAIKNNYLIAYYYLGVLWWHGLGCQQNYEKAFKCFKKHSDDYINSFTSYYLGYAYYKGLGVTVDYHQAFIWFKNSAEIGNYDGRITLAYFYYRGIGVEKNLDEALKIADALYCEYSLNRNHRLIYLLHQLLIQSGDYERDKEIMKDENKREYEKPPKVEIIPPGIYYDYLREHDKRYKACMEKKEPYSTYSDEELDVLCKQGNDDAIMRRAYQYLDCHKDNAAYELIKRRLDEGGHKKLYSVFGYMFYYGRHFDKDYKHAIACYKIAKNEGNYQQALFNIGLIHKLAYEDYETCNRYMFEAANAGVLNAQEYLYSHYSLGDYGFPQDETEALYWGELAAKNGSKNVQRLLGIHYYYKEDKRAIKYFMDAADQEDGYACTKLAHCYFYGKLVEVNPYYANALYYLGAANDSNEACDCYAHNLHFREYIRRNDIASVYWLTMARDRDYTLAKIHLKRWFKIDS